MTDAALLYFHFTKRKCPFTLFNTTCVLLISVKFFLKILKGFSISGKELFVGNNAIVDIRNP
jgi:hypothetical protein